MKAYKASLPALSLLEETVQKMDLRITAAFSAAVHELVTEYGHAPEIRAALLNVFDELNERRPQEARVQIVCAIRDAHKTGYKDLEQSLVCAWGHMFAGDDGTTKENKLREIQIINRFDVGTDLQAKARDVYKP